MIDLRQSAEIVDTNLVALAYANFGAYLDVRKRPAQAEALLRRALELRTTTSGTSDSDLAHSLGLLAFNQDQRGKLIEGERLHRRALEVMKRYLPDEHPSVLGEWNNSRIISHDGAAGQLLPRSTKPFSQRGAGPCPRVI